MHSVLKKKEKKKDIMNSSRKKDFEKNKIQGRM